MEKTSLLMNQDVFIRSNEFLKSHNHQFIREKKDNDYDFNSRTNLDSIQSFSTMNTKRDSLIEISNLRESFTNIEYNSTDCNQEVEQEQEFVELSQIQLIKNKNYKYYGETEFKSREGFGCCWQSDYFYKGQWKNDKMHGLGMLTLSNLTIEGEFKSGKADGFAVVNKDGISYQGIMKNFCFIEGSVLLVTTINSIIELVLEENIQVYDLKTKEIPLIKIKGVGKCINKDQTKYEGQIQDMTQEGVGILTKDNATYSGLRENKQFKGYCEINYQDGTKFYGNFSSNKKNGFGFFLKDNLLNISTYKDNNKNGGSITRKIENNNEILIYENFHHGLKSQRIENRNVIENYIKTYYQEQIILLSMNYNKIAKFLKNEGS